MQYQLHTCYLGQRRQSWDIALSACMMVLYCHKYETKTDTWHLHHNSLNIYRMHQCHLLAYDVLKRFYDIWYVASYSFAPHRRVQERAWMNEMSNRSLSPPSEYFLLRQIMLAIWYFLENSRFVQSTAMNLCKIESLLLHVTRMVYLLESNWSYLARLATLNKSNYYCWRTSILVSPHHKP